MVRARTALLAGIIVLAVLVVGPAKVAAPPAPGLSPSGTATACVVNQARCTPLVPGGAVSAPVAARVLVTVGSVLLSGSALVFLVRGRRRATRLAPGSRLPSSDLLEVRSASPKSARH